MLLLRVLGTLLFVSFAIAQSGESSDGTFFALTFPPQKSDIETGTCAIQIQAKVQSTVTVEHDGSIKTYQAYPNETLQVSALGSDRSLEGVQSNLVYYISSNNPISVIAYSTVQTDQMDAVLVTPVTPTSLEYYTVMYINPDGFNYDCGTSTNTAAYIVISATENTTIVDIYQPGQGVPDETITLNRNQVFTRRTTLANNLEDLSGYRIVASKPVAVSSGSACTHYATTTSYDSGVTWTSLPPVSSLRSGLHLSYEPEWPQVYYSIMVVATSDGTNVNIDGISEILDQGQKREVAIVSETAEVSCNQSCLVVQVHRNYNDDSGIFQTVLTPVSEYNRYSAVSTAVTVDPMAIHYVHVITTSTLDDARGILINGLSIQTWECFEGTITANICKSNTRITGDRPARLDINSQNEGVLFSGMVYSQNTLAEGYGINLGFNAANFTDGPPSSTTRLGYRIYHEMNFTSSDGTDFDADCSQDYSTEFQRSSLAMVFEVNSRVGSQLCSGLSVDDIYMLSVTSTMVFAGNTGTAVDAWRLAVQGSLLLSDIESCASEVSTYLADTSNWQDPIIPDLPDCPGVRFNSDFFTETDTEWICPSSASFDMNKTASSKTDLLKYGVSHDGFLLTLTGEVLTPQCAVAYSTELESATESQILAVNDRIKEGSLCPGPALIITGGSASMTGVNNEAYSNQNYVLDPPDSLRLDEVYACAADISAYLLPHDNWPDPILRNITGCPPLSWNPAAFFEKELVWLCT